MKTVAILICLMPVAVLAHAFSLTKLWGWYVVGTFGLPALSLAQAYGLSMTISLFASATPNHSTDDDDPVPGFVGRWIIGPFFAVFVGWLGTFFL